MAKYNIWIYAYYIRIFRYCFSYKGYFYISYDDLKKLKEKPKKTKFEPKEPKIRRPGTGCVYQISDNLWEGSYSPRLPNGKRKKFNVYAKTREECEKKLALCAKPEKNKPFGFITKKQKKQIQKIIY